MAVLIDGRRIAAEIKDEIKAKVSEMAKKPCLAVIIAGEDPASLIYIRDKRIACEYTGIKFMLFELPETTPENEAVELVMKLNRDPEVDGILFQQPFPVHYGDEKILLSIDPAKDVDCLHPYNAGLLSVGKPFFLPGTPAGIIMLLKRTGIEIAGKRCVVVGRSNIVGKPVSALLLMENATVTTCHSKTRDLPEICRTADILVAAVRKPGFITGDMIKEGAAVIDVGIHSLGGKKRCGDVDFASCEKKAGYITPVPGGVGPMTVAMLMENCLKASALKNGRPA